jgi:lysophospholipase L1-like esterase
MALMDSLPKVYLIGDSIAAGYAPAVEHQLSREMKVLLRPDNGKDTRTVLASLEGWLSGVTPDVIHFNCGLHDIKRPHGSNRVHVPVEEYEENLHILVKRMREYTGRLIWARTTPVIDGQPHPSKSFDRLNRDVDAYNLVADRVMASLGVFNNDLHGAIITAGVPNCLSDDGVHMTEFGNDILGARVAESVCNVMSPGHDALKG